MRFWCLSRPKKFAICLAIFICRLQFVVLSLNLWLKIISKLQLIISESTLTVIVVTKKKRIAWNKGHTKQQMNKAVRKLRTGMIKFDVDAISNVREHIDCQTSEFTLMCWTSEDREEIKARGSSKTWRKTNWETRKDYTEMICLWYLALCFE